MRTLTHALVCAGLGAVEDDGRWVHPLCQPLAATRHGPFVELSDGSLGTIDEQGLRSSRDEGATWTDATPVCAGVPPTEPAAHYVVRTRAGVLVMLYLDMGNWKFSWDDAVGEPKDDCRLELWVVRSEDGGKTWVDRQRVLDGYNANFFGFIETRTGRLVACVEHLVTNPGHWVALSLFSEDAGKTWKRSNLIDVGGHGHHDGATEPTLAELSDGRLLMLIRTNLDRFWQAFSEDGGRYWRTIEPTQIDASSSPGHLLRLRSGRLALAWNRVRAAGSDPGRPLCRALSALEMKPTPASEVVASWFREELSLAFSTDDGRTWTEPLVIARQKGGQLSYPYLFERRPGELWALAGFAFKAGWKEPLPLRLKINETELVRTMGASQK
ncbi:MAG: hypothetical protein A3K19_26495 [Lentisphaerae bacterium RIFOXYB12_FULL_65_16]|nr:MAG: hypothetical protein A3K18_08665 [Lentisphaerae bacterium RIFOXYA12_64_32]OGV87824.1 MAG: hypothetical protein A3K19_26495 [Lentisphaerae bacterium RIFOXYB12_FULL_65_16]